MSRYHGKVEGWLSERDAAVCDCLLTFQNHTGILGDLLEIGVWKGRSAILQALHTRQSERLVLVDPSIPPEVRRVIETAARSGPTYLEMRSSELAHCEIYREGARAFRWVHVDGEHSSQAVANDLDVGNRLLGDGGIIAIDDFMDCQYPQVTRQTFEYISCHRSDLQLFLCGFDKGYLCRPEAARSYLAFLKESFYGEMSGRGHDQVTIFKTAYPSDMNCFGIGDRRDGWDYWGPDDDETTIPI